MAGLADAITIILAESTFYSGHGAVAKIKAGSMTATSHPHQQLWKSCFTGIALIVNELTLPHRDRGGEGPGFDLLFSLGTHTKAYLSTPNLGARFSYQPGNIVVINGRALLHEVDEWEGEGRICFTFFFKDKVLERCGFPRPMFSMLQNVLGPLGVVLP